MKKNIILGIIIVLVVSCIVFLFIKNKIIVRPNSDYVATIYHSQMMGMDAGWGSTYYIYPTEDGNYMWIKSETTITIKGESKEKDVDSGIIKNQNELQDLVTDIENSKRPDAQQYISYTYINNGTTEKIDTIEELAKKLFDKNTENENIEKMKELTDFNITVSSYLNLMPTVPEDDSPKKAYFRFDLVGIDKENFMKDYEIESIKLNDTYIANTDITYNDYNGFRFYTEKFNTNNVIEMTLKNKNTNELYYKELKVKTEIVV